VNPRDAAAPSVDIREGEATSKAGEPFIILPVAARPVTDAASADAYFRGCYAVLVRGKAVRRHLYLSLGAAERVVRNANARGDRAEMVLVQLVPVRGGRDD
jgi:hypothetical protein